MTKHVHNVSHIRDHSFIKQKRKDPFTRQVIKAGDRVVFCAICKVAFLVNSWEAIDNQHCNQQNTLRDFPPPLEVLDIRTKWETPDIHGWNASQVQAWQREVTQKLGIPVVYHDQLKNGTKGPKMVLIPPGKYWMGSLLGESECYGNEGPQHQVTIRQPFLLGQCALSFNHYDHYCEVIGLNKPYSGSSFWARADHPVINVSWDDAKAYCWWLSEQTGQKYRLPSESEWEYACRSGTTTPFWWGQQISTDQANYDGNFVYDNGTKGKYRKKMLPVASFALNAWGLYQMHGNVSEWVEDGWHDSYSGAPNDGRAWVSSDTRRVSRGGSWDNGPRKLRSAARSWNFSTERWNHYGIRLARTL